MKEKVFDFAIPFPKAERLLLAREPVFVSLNGLSGSWERILVTDKRGSPLLATSLVQL